MLELKLRTDGITVPDVAPAERARRESESRRLRREVISAGVALMDAQYGADGWGQEDWCLACGVNLQECYRHMASEGLSCCEWCKHPSDDDDDAGPVISIPVASIHGIDENPWDRRKSLG
jgi:hypothetical protein